MPRSFGMMQKVQAMVAAFGDLQIGVVARRELDALFGDEVEEGIVRGGRGLVHGRHDAFESCGPVIAETLGKASRIASGSAPMQPVTMTRPFSFSAAPIAASDSALALSRKPQVLTITASAPACDLRQFVALRAQAREDAFGIDERLRAAQRDEGDARRSGHGRGLATRRPSPQGRALTALRAWRSEGLPRYRHDRVGSPARQGIDEAMRKTIPVLSALCLAVCAPPPWPRMRRRRSATTPT